MLNRLSICGLLFLALSCNSRLEMPKSVFFHLEEIDRNVAEGKADQICAHLRLLSAAMQEEWIAFRASQLEPKLLPVVASIDKLYSQCYPTPSLDVLSREWMNIRSDFMKVATPPK